MKLKTVTHLLLPLALAQISLADVRISEFLASNNSILVPGQAGTGYHDWIELENTDDTPVDISNWTLTDNANKLEKWTFPAGTIIPANSFLVVLANGNDSPDANGILQTNFSLSADGEFLGLVNPNGTIISSFGPDGSDYPPQSADISYGISPIDGSSVYFPTPTPGAANSAAALLPDSITFSAERGHYSTPFSLTLSTSDSGATIYYTLDGRSPLSGNGDPASHAKAYTRPISVTSTTILRAATTKPGPSASAIQTHSYIFPAAVAVQTKPADYATTWGYGVTGSYAVNRTISQSSVDAQRFLTGMHDLPTISVVTDKNNLFGPDGLYMNTQKSDEKAVSAEYFEPAASGQGLNKPVLFQIDCGMRIQGGASRNTASTAKHSFSLRFRKTFGDSQVNAEVFPGAKISEYNALHLRANYNNSWTHSDGSQRKRANLFTDQFARDSYIAMGHDDGGNGRFVNLFLNGLYWGVYNLHERPNARHYAAYSNGKYSKDDVVGYNPGNYTTVERASFTYMKSVCAFGTWEEIKQVLDVDSYIDYYIINHFGHNDDLKTDDNWRAAGGGPANAPWKFYPWDVERTLENPTNTGNLAISQDGAQIIDFLKNIPEFRVRFADRAYKHLHHNGALTNPANRARVLARVHELDNAVVGESARWGDNRSGGNGPNGIFTRADNWLPAIYGPLSVQPTNGLLGNNGWFPLTGTNRTDRMITKWKSESWTSGGPKILPAIDPPAFLIDGIEQHGGTVYPGQSLTLGSSPGDIYFTTDGRDPRLEGGAVRAGLTPYTGGSIPIPNTGMLSVRWKNGDQWSALSEAQFTAPHPAGPGDLLITEVHYHPTDPTPEELASRPDAIEKDFQFLEILNISQHELNLEGCTLSVGIEFTFPIYRLSPGERLIVVETPKAFALRFPDAIPPAGKWSGSLSKSGETIVLSDAAGNLIDAFTYSDSEPWPHTPDGEGDSLNRLGLSSNGDLPSSWTAAPPTPGEGIILNSFDNWAITHGITNPMSDTDGDGIPALLKYALLLDPTEKAELPTLTHSEGRYSMQFSRDPGRSDYDVRIWGSTDLSDWTPMSEEILSSSPNRETLKVTTPQDAPSYFLQIRANPK